MRRQIFEAFVTPEIETPTLFGCLSLFPYFVVIYAVNHLGFVYNHFGIGMTGLLCLFCLIVLFCGGFLINFMAVSNVFISRMHEKVVCPCVCVSSICWLFLFSSIFALSTSDESPIHQYWQLSQSPMRGLGICDTNEWKDSTRGLYFRNGAISRNGMLFDTFQVNVHKCTRLNTKGPWNSCSFRVRPIVPRADCTDVKDCTWEICAWDIARADEPDSWINPNGTAATLGVPRCDEPDLGGLCGWVTTLGRMVGGYNGADEIVTGSEKLPDQVTNTFWPFGLPGRFTLASSGRSRAGSERSFWLAAFLLRPSLLLCSCHGISHVHLLLQRWWLRAFR